MKTAEWSAKVMVGVALLTLAGVVSGCAQGNSRPADRADRTSAPVSPTTVDYDRLAVAELDNIVRGDNVAAVAGFDTVMRQRLSPQDIANAWKTYQELLGTYKSHAAPEDVKHGRFTVVNMSLQMANAPGQFRLTFDESGQIAGLFLLKAGVPS
jgi:hypothetical protein